MQLHRNFKNRSIYLVVIYFDVDKFRGVIRFYNELKIKQDNGHKYPFKLTRQNIKGLFLKTVDNI